MRIGVETKTENNVRYTVDFTGHGEVTVIAKSLKSGRTKLCTYETADYSFRDGYTLDDVLEVYRITDEFIEGLKDG